MASIRIIYASGSGHTEHVVMMLARMWQQHRHRVVVTRAETAHVSDMSADDLLILASGTWNTGGVEGQLHPYMYTYLMKTVKDADITGTPCTLIALGDNRYYYTARAGEYLRKYIVDHGGKVAVNPLTIINEPYDQEEKIKKWGESVLAFLTKK